MEAGVGNAAELALEAVRDGDAGFQGVVRRVPVGIETGVAIVECKLPLAVDGQPVGTFELGLGEFGARHCGQEQAGGGNSEDEESAHIREGLFYARKDRANWLPLANSPSKSARNCWSLPI